MHHLYTLLLWAIDGIDIRTISESSPKGTNAIAVDVRTEDYAARNRQFVRCLTPTLWEFVIFLRLMIVCIVYQCRRL